MSFEEAATQLLLLTPLAMWSVKKAGVIYEHQRGSAVFAHFFSCYALEERRKMSLVGKAHL